MLGQSPASHVPFDGLQVRDKLTDEWRKMQAYATMVGNMDRNIGRPDSDIWYAVEWGQVSAAPYPIWKAHPSQGGLLVPAILNLPGKSGGEINQELFRLMDDMPTFLELAGIVQAETSITTLKFSISRGVHAPGP